MRWFATHGFYLGPKDGITHRVLGPWHDEHTTAPHTGTVIFANETAWPAFHCSHVHCEGRTLLNVMAIWGGADQFSASPWQGGVMDNLILRDYQAEMVGGVRDAWSSARSVIAWLPTGGGETELSVYLPGAGRGCSGRLHAVRGGAQDLAGQAEAPNAPEERAAALQFDPKRVLSICPDRVSIRQATAA